MGLNQSLVPDARWFQESGSEKLLNSGDNLIRIFNENEMGASPEADVLGVGHFPLHFPGLVGRGKVIEQAAYDERGVRDVAEKMVDRVSVQLLKEPEVVAEIRGKDVFHVLPVKGFDSWLLADFRISSTKEFTV